MLNRKTNLFRTVTLTVAMLMVTASAWAQAVTMPITAVGGPMTVLDPGRVWVDEDMIVHLRGRVFTYENTGDLTGTSTVTLNLNFHMITGDGDCSGTHTFVGTLFGVPGGHSGRFADSDMIGFVFANEGVGQGFYGGARVRVKTVTSGVLFVPGSLISGTALFPNGT